MLEYMNELTCDKVSKGYSEEGGDFVAFRKYLVGERKVRDPRALIGGIEGFGKVKLNKAWIDWMTYNANPQCPLRYWSGLVYELNRELSERYVKKKIELEPSDEKYDYLREEYLDDRFGDDGEAWAAWIRDEDYEAMMRRMNETPAPVCTYDEAVRSGKS